MTIGPFRDEYRWLSNFWESQIQILSHTYPTVEHFYQSMKCADPFDRIAIMSTETPGQAKRLGASVVARPDWDEIKVSVMRIGAFSKFSQNRELAQKLLDTNGQALIEYNHWHDNFWGYCTCDDCQPADHLNNLGEILSDVREHLNKRARGALFI